MPAEKKDETLDLLRIRKEQVPVGELTLTLKTATLAQQRDVLALLQTVDLSPLFSLLGPVFREVRDGDRVAAIMKYGPGLYAEAVRFLGQALASLAGNQLGALLDNAENYRLLKNGETPELTQDDAEVMGGRHVRSEGLRNWVSGSLTLGQTVNLLKVAVEVNGWAAAGKALAGLLAAGKPQEKVGSQPTGPEGYTDLPEGSVEG